MQQVFETQLSRKILQKRLILLFMTLVFVAGIFLCHHLLEDTKQTVSQPIGDSGYMREKVVYQESYKIALMISSVLACASILLLIRDLFRCRFRSFQKGDQWITVYRGSLYCIVYVDCAEKARTIPLPQANYVDVWLRDRVRATVHFVTRSLEIAHISFSDHTATVVL